MTQLSQTQIWCTQVQLRFHLWKWLTLDVNVALFSEPQLQFSSIEIVPFKI